MLVIAEAVNEVIRNINDANKIKEVKRTFLNCAISSLFLRVRSPYGTASRSYRPRVIDGKKIASDIEAGVKREVEIFIKEHNFKQRLLQSCGEHPPSKLYVKLKHWACKRVGIISEDHKFPQETRQDEIIELIKTLNMRPEIHGILVQLPLPRHIDERTVMMQIAPEKDVDGFNPLNMGKLFIGREDSFRAHPKG